MVNQNYSTPEKHQNVPTQPTQMIQSFYNQPQNQQLYEISDPSTSRGYKRKNNEDEFDQSLDTIKKKFYLKKTEYIELKIEELKKKLTD